MLKNIKKLSIASAIALIVSSPAFALGDGTATATNTAGALSGSTALSGSQSGVNSDIRSQSLGVGTATGDVAGGTGIGGNNGQAQRQGNYNQFDMSNHSVNNGADLSKAVGNPYAPALTTTLTETCMGSTSVGGGFSGGSFSFGTTWRDHACVRRLDAREIHSYGDIQAAKEIMCDSDLVREAFKRVGRPCAEDGGTYAAVSQPTPSPVVEQAPAPTPAPSATAVRVHDEQDSMAQRTQAILDKAEASSKVLHEKYGM